MRPRRQQIEFNFALDDDSIPLHVGGVLSGTLVVLLRQEDKRFLRRVYQCTEKVRSPPPSPTNRERMASRLAPAAPIREISSCA